MRMIFRNTRTNEEQVMPVTPSGFQLTAGRLVESLDMAQTGQVNLSGLPALFNEQIEFLLPAEARNYTAPGYSGDPYAIVDKLAQWSNDGDVLRFIVTGTPVNVPVLLPPIQYREDGGAGDVTVTLTLREYRYLEAETTEKTSTGNTGRSVETAKKADTVYTVVKGDTLWGISRRYYGSGQLAYKLAAYNGIKNANLIFPKQKINIPDKSLL